VALALPGPFALRARVKSADERTPTVSDVAALVRVLRDEQGWDRARIIERTKTPYGIAFVSGLQQALGPVHAAPPPAADSASVALLLTIDGERLPDPLPASWRTLRRTAEAATVLVLTHSRIDWHSLLICVEPADGSARHCEESGWNPQAMGGALLPHMPAGGAWRGTLELWLPLRPEGPETHVAMPHTLLVCGGRIVSASDRTIAVAPSQRFAVIAASAGEKTEPSVLKLAWDVGAPECDLLAYDGLPPFFVEGDPDTVRLLAAVLSEQATRREAGEAQRASGSWHVLSAAHAQSTPAEPSALIDRVLDRIDRSLLRRCLTPDAGRAMSDLVAAGALTEVLGDDLVLARGDVGGDRIELRFQDPQQRSHTITLALPGAVSGQPDGKGARFLYYVSATADLTPAIRSTMLAAAAVFDGGIPETALRRCAGAEAPKADPRYPRSIALGSALLELMIVLAAVVFGLRALRTST
jgi:hypothetical protein